MQLKHVNQQFGLGFKPSQKDYLKVVGRKYKKRMAWIEGRESKKKKIDVPPIHNTFSYPTCIIQPHDKVRNLNEVFIDITIYNLKEKEIEDCVIYPELRLIFYQVVTLPQLTINTLEETTSIEQLVKRCIEHEEFNNLKEKKIQMMFKFK
jgi:hypothetical protein